MTVYSQIGYFLTACSAFECVVDVAIKQQLGIDYRKAEILTVSLNFKARISILRSLLVEQKPNFDKAIDTLDIYENESKRNRIFHSHIFSDQRGEKITFVSGRADRKYTSKNDSFDEEQLKAHALKISKLGQLLMSELHITESDLNQFTSIRFTDSIV